jgi:hypothetical protein
MRKLLVGLSALSVILCAAPAFAGVALSASGNVPGTISGLVTPPANAMADTSLNYQVWNEQLGTLASPVTLDFNGAVGSYNGTSTFTPTTLAAGTTFGTTYVQLNPGVDGIVHSGEATIQFSSPIIGIALQNPFLDQTDNLGAPGTTYPTGYGIPSDNRGIDNRTNDAFIVSNGGKTLEVLFTTNFDAYDSIRVFTANNSSFVPEPASLIVWSVLGTVMTGGAWWRRQRLAV